MCISLGCCPTTLVASCSTLLTCLYKSKPGVLLRCRLTCFSLTVNKLIDTALMCVWLSIKSGNKLHGSKQKCKAIFWSDRFLVTVSPIRLESCHCEVCKTTTREKAWLAKNTAVIVKSHKSTIGGSDITFQKQHIMCYLVRCWEPFLVRTMAPSLVTDIVVSLCYHLIELLTKGEKAYFPKCQTLLNVQQQLYKKSVTIIF